MGKHVNESQKSKDIMNVKAKKAESKYDATELRRLIKEGRSAAEIMNRMGIAHKQILKHHILKLISTDREYYDIPGLYERKNRKAFVNSNGEIKLKMSNIDFGDMPLKPGTEFEVLVEGNDIILKNLSMTATEMGETDSTKEAVKEGTEEFVTEN